jgi:hypothetical protein
VKFQSNKLQEFPVDPTNYKCIKKNMRKINAIGTMSRLDANFQTRKIIQTSNSAATEVVISSQGGGGELDKLRRKY